MKPDEVFRQGQSMTTTHGDVRSDFFASVIRDAEFAWR